MTPLFYVRYVDDIALAIDNVHIDEILIKFNSYHPRLQFTMEIGKDSLNFLDICLIKKEETFIFDWYHKSMFSSRFLNPYVANQKILYRSQPRYPGTSIQIYG